MRGAKLLPCYLRVVEQLRFYGTFLAMLCLLLLCATTTNSTLAQYHEQPYAHLCVGMSRSFFFHFLFDNDCMLVLPFTSFSFSRCTTPFSFSFSIFMGGVFTFFCAGTRGPNESAERARTSGPPPLPQRHARGHSSRGRWRATEGVHPYFLITF